MGKNVITVTKGVGDIKQLWARRREIKNIMDNLKFEDNAIVEALNEKLGVDLQKDSTVNYDVDGVILKVTPKINRNVNTESAKALLAEDPDAQRFSDLFKVEYKLAEGKWKALKPEEQAIFKDCVTEKPGKTEYKEDSK